MYKLNWQIKTLFFSGSNTIFLAADIPALGAETAATTLGLESAAAAAEVLGPVGMAVSVAAIVIAELAQAEVQVWKTLVYEIIIMQNGTRAAIGQFPSM